MVLVKNFLSGEVVLPDSNQSKLRRGMDSADIALVRGLHFQVGYQGKLRVNSDADEALA